jgi:hypothetical protein
MTRKQEQEQKQKQERSHAFLSPSGAHRWLHCTPSARLEEGFADTESVFAKEGTLCHALAELLLRSYAGLIPFRPFKTKLAELSSNELYTEEMREHAEAYADFVKNLYEQAKHNTPDAKLEIETRFDLTEYVPEAFGTADAAIIADRKLHVIDLKYGRGVTVSSENNPQMKLYALGAVRQFGWLYGFDSVSVTIFQPRTDNLSTCDLTVPELLRWGEEVLKPAARMAYAGEGEFRPGEHCRFCRARVRCRAQAEEQLKLAAYEFRDPALLNDGEIADILRRTDSFTNWLKAVGEHALSEALNGKHWPGFKLVEGRSTRRYADEAAAAAHLLAQGYEENDVYVRSVVGITALTKLLGKKKFETLMGEHLIKPPGKPTLAPESDPREELHGEAEAARDFAEPLEGEKQRQQLDKNE